MSKLAIPREALDHVDQLIGFEDQDHRDQFIGMLTVALPLIVATELERMADQIDRGPEIPLPPSIYSALVRERAEDVRAINVEES